MKRIALLALIVSSAASHALVFPIFAPFPTPVFLQEGFDTTLAGSYGTLPVFSGIGTASAIGPGVMVVTPYPGVVSVPHLMVGRSADVEIKTVVPMRRFGGYFNSGFFGLFSSTATFNFFDASNTPIGSMTVPLTPVMQWYGFFTIPKWQRVEIIGNVPGFQGLVGMDSLRIRPN